MALGGDQLCSGCLTMSAAWTGGTCSACMLRESNEKIAKQQMQQMQQMQDRQSQPPGGYVSNPSSAASELLGGLLGFVLVVGLAVWAFSDMGYWESVYYIIMIPIWILKYLFQLFLV